MSPASPAPATGPIATVSAHNLTSRTRVVGLQYRSIATITATTKRPASSPCVSVSISSLASGCSVADGVGKWGQDGRSEGFRECPHPTRGASYLLGNRLATQLGSPLSWRPDGRVFRRGRETCAECEVSFWSAATCRRFGLCGSARQTTVSVAAKKESGDESPHSKGPQRQAGKPDLHGVRRSRARVRRRRFRLRIPASGRCRPGRESGSGGGRRRPRREAPGRKRR